MGSGNLYNPRTNTFSSGTWLATQGDKISLTNSGSYFYFTAKQSGKFLVQAGSVTTVEKASGETIATLYTPGSGWHTSCVTAM